MFKSFTACLLAASVAFTPALAQDAAPVAPVAPVAQVDKVESPTPGTLRLKVSTDMNEDRENILLLDLSNGERVAIRLMPDWAPNHVNRIKVLTREGFYDGVIFHRVIEGFMAQTGDPTGTGEGGSRLPDLEEEFNPMPHVRGTVSMARAQSPDSANSQFFIVFYPRLGLDKNYTVFGRVIGNMAAVDAIQRGEPPANPTYVVQASIAADDRPQRFAPPPAPPAPARIAPQLDGNLSEIAPGTVQE